MPAGRPTIYEESYIEKVKAYIESCEDKVEVIGGEKPVVSRTVNLPTIEGLAFFLKVNKTTIYEWCKEYPEFSNVIEELREKQARELVNKGLSGAYNPTIAKVLLTKHGYREGTDITSNEEKLQTGVIILPQKNESPLEAPTQADRSAGENGG